MVKKKKKKIRVFNLLNWKNINTMNICMHIFMYRCICVKHTLITITLLPLTPTLWKLLGQLPATENLKFFQNLYDKRNT